MSPLTGDLASLVGFLYQTFPEGGLLLLREWP